jgi:protein-S-isoprenylcysteine O-methyltransferase Ste14
VEASVQDYENVTRRAGALPWRIASSLPIAVLWALFAAANFRAALTAKVPLGLGATSLELLTAVLLAARRQPLCTSRSPFAWAVAAVGTFGMLAARPDYHPVAGLEPLYALLQIAGSVIAAAALVALGRSIGIVAANRGVRTHGMYAFVRHPLYSGYLFATSGYVLENPSLRNAGIFAAVTLLQGLRIRAEERLLCRDATYRAYCRRVRWRLIPFVV